MLFYSDTVVTETILKAAAEGSYCQIGAKICAPGCASYHIITTPVITCIDLPTSIYRRIQTLSVTE